MNQPTLKPCPFCGINLEKIWDSDHYVYAHNYDNNCIITGYFYYEDEIDRWNTRTQPEEVNDE